VLALAQQKIQIVAFLAIGVGGSCTVMVVVVIAVIVAIVVVVIHQGRRQKATARQVGIVRAVRQEFVFELLDLALKGRVALQVVPISHLDVASFANVVVVSHRSEEGEQG